MRADSTSLSTSNSVRSTGTSAPNANQESVLPETTRLPPCTVPAVKLRSPEGKVVSSSTLPDFEVTFTSETVPVSSPLVRNPTSPGAVFDVTVRVSRTVPSTFVTTVVPSTVMEYSCAAAKSKPAGNGVAESTE